MRENDDKDDTDTADDDNLSLKPPHLHCRCTVVCYIAQL
jgi:hypothetical protein